MRKADGAVVEPARGAGTSCADGETDGSPAALCQGQGRAVFGGAGDLRRCKARQAAQASEALSAVDARPFQRLCMGDLRVISPRNFSDFPSHFQLFLIRCADERLVDGI